MAHTVPGDSDLSINGRKFCGTAQRKRLNTVTLVCYISINGNQNERSNLVKGFYEAMGDTTLQINPDKMDTLAHLTSSNLSVSDVAQLFINEIIKRSDDYLFIDDYDQSSADFITSLEFTRNQNTRWNK